MAKKYPDEKVLVISRALFDELGAFHGIQPEVGRYMDAILTPENNSFLARDDAEEDPSFKQIIPYAIFRCGDRFLHYVRGGGSGEKRLAAKGSVGIGGHVNEDDFHATGSLGRELYEAGVDREVNEELRIETSYRQSIVALLNDDTNEVGQVHLGVVHLFELEEPKVAANEDNITAVEFLTRKELAGRADRLETWSQLCVEGLDRLMAAPV